MKREWKPGDVGLTAKGRLALRRENNPDGWIDSQGAPWSNDRFPENVRPLVVIDPEDREAVERLLRGYAGWNNSDDIKGYPHYVAEMQAALREFANPTPPKPDEPMGLGAVVEDEYGTRWTRVEQGEAETRNPWYPSADPDMQPDEWDRIKAVRILSEGVTR